MIAWAPCSDEPAARRRRQHVTHPYHELMPEQRLPIIGSSGDPAPIETVLGGALRAAGLTVVMERWEPRPHQLGEAIGRLRSREYLGAVVIAPHKERAASLVGGLSEDAKVSGALNLVVRGDARLSGHNTDVDGIRAGLAAILPKVRGKWPRTAVVLGAGGGARAAVSVLIGSGFQHIAVFNRHLHKAEALVGDLAKVARHMELRARPWHETILEAELGRAGLVIDASGLGADEAAVAVPPEALPERLYVLDLALHRASTPLMREAQARGATVANGQVSFLAAQAASFRLLTGADAPAAVLRSALDTALGLPQGETAVVGD
jgi:shikimate dehydrogenase